MIHDRTELLFLGQLAVFRTQFGKGFRNLFFIRGIVLLVRIIVLTLIRRVFAVGGICVWQPTIKKVRKRSPTEYVVRRSIFVTP
jgi:hypothetical protein